MSADLDKLRIIGDDVFSRGRSAENVDAFLIKNMDRLPALYEGQEQEAVSELLTLSRTYASEKLSNGPLTYTSAPREGRFLTTLQALGKMIEGGKAFNLDHVGAGDLLLLREAVGFIRENRDTPSRKIIAVSGKQASTMYQRGDIPSSHDAPVVAKLRNDFPHSAVLDEKHAYLAGHLITEEHFVFHTTVATTENQKIRALAGDLLVDIIATHPWMKDLAKGQKVDFATVRALREQAKAEPNEASARAGIDRLTAGAASSFPAARS